MGFFKAIYTYIFMYSQKKVGKDIYRITMVIPGKEEFYFLNVSHYLNFTITL